MEGGLGRRGVGVGENELEQRRTDDELYYLAHHELLAFL